MSFGRYFEDFDIGDVYDHFPGKTITESDNNLFCLLTMNHHPVHLDWQFAEGTQHQKVLVVGTLVFSLIVGLTVRDVSGRAIANLEYESVVHLAPVHIGDTLHARTTVLDKQQSQSKQDRGVVQVETTASNQLGKPVLRFRRKVLVPLRNATT
ncbi:MAG TPA: MaoC family dehydratase [Verrucomicrobiota bacterium]|nr:dehydratase [Verrucomicrobiales bacterium]HRI11759.1 MaoC family dehydratase [Verrucomicrobiota bacterium]